MLELLSFDDSFPVQVNLEFGSSGQDLQVAFVTFDYAYALTVAPRVELCAGFECVTFSGYSTRAPEPQFPQRIYTYSFVPLPSLKYDVDYTYRAIGGTIASSWGPSYSFKRSSGSQSFALFGDQIFFNWQFNR